MGRFLISEILTIFPYPPIPESMLMQNALKSEYIPTSSLKICNKRICTLTERFPYKNRLIKIEEIIEGIIVIPIIVPSSIIIYYGCM